jgi:hypothetical protein
MGTATSTVRAFEDESGTGMAAEYGLGITVVIDEEHPAESEILRVNDVIVRWARRRGAQAANLFLTYTAPQARHDDILGWTHRILSQDSVGPVVAGLNSVTVRFADPATGEVSDFSLQQNGQE